MNQPDISSCKLGYQLPTSHSYLMYHDIQLPDDQPGHIENTFPADQVGWQPVHIAKISVNPLKKKNQQWNVY